MTSSLLDSALDLAVVPGYSRLGPALRRLRWADAAASDLRGRTALVTGGTSGSARRPARASPPPARPSTCSGATPPAARRPPRESNRACPARRTTPARSLRSLRSAQVRRFAEGFLARDERLDVLVHNAGVLTHEREFTPDGLERTFATNVLGPFLLTRLLLPALRAAVPSRVITVSSGGMYTARLQADDPQLNRRAFDGPSSTPTASVPRWC